MADTVAAAGDGDNGMRSKWDPRPREKKRERQQQTRWMVQGKYCKGCRYYGDISGRHKCCDYTYLTGKLRRGDTAHCKVRRER